jgi:hypothetical protein
MNGLVRKFAPFAFCFCGLLAAGVATAGVPDPPNAECSAPYVRIVGHNGAVGDPAGEFCATIRDFNNVPVVNATVVIDFSSCDVQLCVDQMDPAVIVDCVSQTVHKRTDAAGRCCFRVIGKRRDLDCAPKPNPCVGVFADGVFICALYAPTFDLENEPGAGVSGNDLSRFLHLFLDCGVYLTAIDYNGNLSMDGDDLSQFLSVFFGAGSAQNCPSTGKCP